MEQDTSKTLKFIQASLLDLGLIMLCVMEFVALLRVICSPSILCEEWQNEQTSLPGVFDCFLPRWSLYIIALMSKRPPIQDQVFVWWIRKWISGSP